jgi:hypothetical protein
MKILFKLYIKNFFLFFVNFFILEHTKYLNFIIDHHYFMFQYSLPKIKTLNCLKIIIIKIFKDKITYIFELIVKFILYIII